MGLLTNYKIYETLSIADKKESLKECVDFFDKKTLKYLEDNLPKDKRRLLKKEPVQVNFVKEEESKITFSDNNVFIPRKELKSDKKDLYFKVAKSTICAVFYHFFFNTATTKNKSTKFSELASSYFLAISNEFKDNTEFLDDMVSAFMGEIQLQSTFE